MEITKEYLTLADTEVVFNFLKTLVVFHILKTLVVFHFQKTRGYLQFPDELMCLLFHEKLRSSSISWKIEVVFHFQN